MRYGGICLGIVLGLCALTGSGCGKKAGEQMDAGRFEGPVYHNDYLGMTITIPADWSVQDREVTRQTARTGEQMLSGNNQNMQAVLEAAESRTVNLFNLFKFPPGSPVPYNPNIYAIAEDNSHTPGIKTGGDYLYHARRLLESGQMEFKFPREVYTETLAGAEFHVMTVDLHVPPTGKMMQEYYATVRKGYVLVLILSYVTEEERAELHHVLDTMTLTPQP